MCRKSLTGGMSFSIQTYESGRRFVCTKFLQFAPAF
jgi:hypothetical protein